MELLHFAGEENVLRDIRRPFRNFITSVYIYQNANDKIGFRGDILIIFSRQEVSSHLKDWRNTVFSVTSYVVQISIYYT